MFQSKNSVEISANRTGDPESMITLTAADFKQ
jgi:hypothetical protein